MDPTAENDAAAWQSPMVDISGLSLEELASYDGDTALARCLRRLSAELDDPAEPTAGFNSAL
ncbi:FxSxx-COOH protein [Actinoplanes sp. KI2]|uniref:FxSxx-COOH cyclophane-containing RiPP peptide n=1 Tax=Actinoplanes sp. KI2 TaxID=2983315 RepID=UPI0021D5D819|nr:FxSxx-COOH cyclophane-containing RiPP peptide [Actinoplanes sp. KI2]MCU7725257.1 FxSxx-COOH protein [Actinoplanes sp. KI2]